MLTTNTARYIWLMASQEEIFANALKLPLTKRAKLAKELIRSLDDGGKDVDGETAWLEEIRRRITEVDAGTVEMREWPTVRDRIAASLKRSRSAVRTHRPRS